MELYYSTGACSLAVHIALGEAGIPYTLHKVNIREGEQKKPEYLKINPKGYVPALKTDSGDVLTEASVILQYIADQKPAQKLFPAPATNERYHALEWLNFVAAEMHKGFGAYFSLGQFTNPETVKDIRAAWDAKMKTRLDYVSNHLSKNKFLLGDQFSVADAYLYTTLNWAPIFKFDLSPWPSILSFMERMNTRPSVQKALEEEGLRPGNKA